MIFFEECDKLLSEIVRYGRIVHARESSDGRVVWTVEKHPDYYQITFHDENSPAESPMQAKLQGRKIRYDQGEPSSAAQALRAAVKVVDLSRRVYDKNGKIFLAFDVIDR